jgi:glycosyltransferase 2 family protein
VAVAAVAWFLVARLASRGFDWQIAGAGIRRLDWRWVAASAVFIYAAYYGRAVRWLVFLKPLKPHPSIRNVLAATVIGFAAITLFGRPGEFVRPYLVARKEKVPVSSQLAAWLLERMFDLLMALFVFAFALTRVEGSGLRVGPQLTWILSVGGKVVGAACGGVLLAILSLRHFAEPVRAWLCRALSFLPESRFLKVQKFVSSFVEGVAATKSDSALLLVLVYSVVEWLLIVACYWCLVRAFAGLIPLGLVDVLIFMGFVSFGSVVQVPGIGGGMQVVAVLVLTELFGIRLELATTFAVAIWMITFVAIVPAGLLWSVHEGLNWRNLRHLGQEAS